MPLANEPDLSRITELEIDLLDEQFPVRRTLVVTSLYSAFLVPTKGSEGLPYDILVIEHPPALAKSAFLWCRRIQGTGTKMEIVREITNAIDYQRERQHNN